jgi:sterile alpha motif and leucine zipper-containing kinase AZK
MAPEVLTDKVSPMAYSLGSDVYSFGVIIWEMLTLELPWGNVGFDHQIEDRVTIGEHLPISPFVPKEYMAIMTNCWHFDSQQRPMFMDLIGKIESIPELEGAPTREAHDLIGMSSSINFDE